MHQIISVFVQETTFRFNTYWPVVSNGCPDNALSLSRSGFKKKIIKFVHKSEKTTSVSSDPPKNNNKETNKQLNYKNKKQNKKELEFKKHLNHSFFPNTSRKRKRMQALL